MAQHQEKETAQSLLGQALIQAGVITQKQLDRALRIQRYLEQPKQVGSILIELGYATKQAIAEALSGHASGFRLGEILQEQGLVSEDTMQQALRLQKEKGIKLGQALIEIGALNERTLLQNLARQFGVPYIEPDFGMLDQALLGSLAPDYLIEHVFLPFSRDEHGCVTIVVNDITDEVKNSISEVFKQSYNLALGPADAIRGALEDFRRFRQDGGGKRKHEFGGAEDAIVQLVEHIIITAIQERASDIHIEPMTDVIRLRYRIDGVLVYKTDLPKELLPRIVSRIKILAEVNITEHQRHQGGRILFESNGDSYDLRLSVYVTVHGESVVLRVLSKQKGLLDISELGMNPAMLERYRYEVLELPTGVVLITGPTGSGKTTTLYSSIGYSNTVDTKIITAEDPVEYMIDGIIQCSIHDKIGRTFEHTLREIVRQDPDIIVLGEIRDRITAETAIQAALTGHKVYSTFHTEDTIGGLLRLIDMDIETFLISSTVISVLAQRLLRRICEHCASVYVPSFQTLDRLGLDAKEIRQYEFTKGNGCTHCSYTGYYGRVGVYELLILNDQVKEAILQKKTSGYIRKTCTASTGLISMREDGIAKVIRGRTTFDEVLRHTPNTFDIRPLHQILAMTQ